MEKIKNVKPITLAKNIVSILLSLFVLVLLFLLSLFVIVFL